MTRSNRHSWLVALISSSLALGACYFDSPTHPREPSEQDAEAGVDPVTGLDAEAGVVT